MKYIFFGSSDFAAIVLNQLIQNNFVPLLIITQPPRPKGRKQILTPTPIQMIAQENNLPFATPSNLNDSTFLQTITKLNPSFALLTAYGKIIPSSLIHLLEKGFVNLHPSLLPQFRGATPLQSAILEGVKETGVTLFQMDEQIDHGPIIANAKFQILNSKITYEELAKELALLGAKLIMQTLPQWLEGKISPQPQNDALATYCHKITKENEKINWHQDVFFIDRQVRALNPTPGVFTLLNNQIIKIIQGTPLPQNSWPEEPKGKIREMPNHKIAVQALNGLYEIDFLKPAGKKIMTSEAFLRGNRWILGQIFQ